MSGTVIEAQNKIAISFYRIPVACMCIHSYFKRLSGFFTRDQASSQGSLLTVPSLRLETS